MTHATYAPGYYVVALDKGEMAHLTPKEHQLVPGGAWVPAGPWTITLWGKYLSHDGRWVDVYPANAIPKECGWTLEAALAEVRKLGARPWTP